MKPEYQYFCGPYDRGPSLARQITTYIYTINNYKYNCMLFMGGLEQGIPRVFVSIARPLDNDIDTDFNIQEQWGPNQVRFFQYYKEQWYEAQIDKFGHQTHIKLFDMDPQFIPACNHGVQLVSQ